MSTARFIILLSLWVLFLEWFIETRRNRSRSALVGQAAFGLFAAEFLCVICSVDLSLVCTPRAAYRSLSSPLLKPRIVSRCHLDF